MSLFFFSQIKKRIEKKKSEKIIIIDIFLPEYPLIVSLFKSEGLRVFLNHENEDPKQKKPLVEVQIFKP